MLCAVTPGVRLIDERLDAQLATVATVLIILLLFGQVVLMGAHLWAPMARTADRLTVDEDAPLYEGPDTSGREAPAVDAPPPAPGPWRWAALAMTLAGAVVGIFAAWRVHAGSAERNRWLAVLVIAGLVVAWGVFTWRLIVRAPVVFQRL